MLLNGGIKTATYYYIAKNQSIRIFLFEYLAYYKAYAKNFTFY